MREVTPRWLWLGHADDVRNIGRLHDVGIEAVVDLAYEEPCAQLSRDIVYCRFPLIDGAGNSLRVLIIAIGTTCSLIRNEIPTLMACSGGMSRSPSILAASLAIIRGAPPQECLRELTVGQPHDVSSTLRAEVLKAYDQLVA